MNKKDLHLRDFAIVLAWPDATIRGDEKWMMFFRKLGIVKNLNFKVGHTWVVIVSHKTGELLYYDFGRYIAPRGYGRARSKFSDPQLVINTKAEISGNKIENLLEIAEAFEEVKPYMYGDGILYFSVIPNIDFELAKQYGDACVAQGTYPYGAVAKNNNNCSRFIARMLMKSTSRFHYFHGLNLPETIKASPTSNLVNGVEDRMIYSYTPKQGVKNFKMNRWGSFFFLVKQLGDNVFTKRAKQLPEDLSIGKMRSRQRPHNLGDDAIYLGGVGDGAWYTSDHVGDGIYKISRYNVRGELEYKVLGKPDERFNPNIPFSITYDSHLLFTTFQQLEVKIRVSHIEVLYCDNPVVRKKKVSIKYA